VDTPLHKNNPKDFLKSLSPMGTISDVKDIVDAVVYLTEARNVTGEVLNAERRLAELGIELGPAPTPIGAYVESVQTGNLLYLSGILPVIGHEPKFVGRLGRAYDVEQGREAARIAALNVLSAARNY